MAEPRCPIRRTILAYNKMKVQKKEKKKVKQQDTQLHVTVEVMEGRNLAPKDRNGKSDPYVILRLEEKEQQSAISYKTLNPTWQMQKFTFPIQSLASPLFMEVFDHDLLGSDDFMGEACMRLDALRNNEPTEIWQALSPRNAKEFVSGDIRLIVTIDAPETSLDRVATLAEQASYGDLLDMVLDANDILLNAVCEPGLCDPSEQDKLAKIFVHIYASHGMVRQLFQAVVAREVQTTEQESTLFRVNTIGTKAMGYYARTTGGDYLKSLLAPFATRIVENPFQFELDEHRLKEGFTVRGNTVALQDIVSEILTAIEESIDTSCPLEIKELCNILKTSTASKFPASTEKVVGGFYCLRFISPAIAAPSAFGIIPTPGKEAMRAFTLVSKVIQNLANGVQFGSKEVCMVVLNDFMNANIPRMQNIFSRLSAHVVEPEDEEPSNDILLSDLISLQKILAHQESQLAPLVGAENLRRALTPQPA